MVGEEDHADAVFAGRRQRDAGFAGDELEEIVRRLDENARAIAGVGLAAASAAMVEIQENLKCLADDRVRLLAFDIDDEADPAGFVFEAWIVQALLWRRTGQCRPAGVLLLLCVVNHLQEVLICGPTSLKFG